MRTFLILAFLLSFASIAGAQENPTDPCVAAAELACSPGEVTDSTGMSSGGAHPPSGYLRAKAQFANTIKARLESFSSSEGWNRVVEYVLNPDRVNRPEGRGRFFQDSKTERLALEACRIERASDRCRDLLIQLLSREFEFTTFTTTDLYYRKSNTRVHDLAPGTIMQVSMFSLYGPITDELLGRQKVGTIFSTLVSEDLLRLNVGLKEVIAAGMSDVRGNLIAPSAVKSRLAEKIVPAVKAAMLEIVRTQGGSQAQELGTKLNSIRYVPPSDELTESEKAGFFDGTPLTFMGLLSANAFYSDQDLEFRVSPGFMFSNTSEFGQLFVVAHELGHPLDPCVLKQAQIDQFWWPSILQSIFKVVTPNRLQAFEGKCVDGSELGEATADTLGAEVLGRHLEANYGHFSRDERIRAVAQSMRPFRCDIHRPTHAPHLSVRDRYEKIILKNTRIRRFLGCR